MSLQGSCKKGLPTHCHSPDSKGHEEGILFDRAELSQHSDHQNNIFDEFCYLDYNKLSTEPTADFRKEDRCFADYDQEKEVSVPLSCSIL